MWVAGWMRFGVRGSSEEEASVWSSSSAAWIQGGKVLAVRCLPGLLSTLLGACEALAFEREDASVMGLEETEWLCDLRTTAAPSVWSCRERSRLDEAWVLADSGRLRLGDEAEGTGEGCRRAGWCWWAVAMGMLGMLWCPCCEGCRKGEDEGAGAGPSVAASRVGRPLALGLVMARPQRIVEPRAPECGGPDREGAGGGEESRSTATATDGGHGRRATGASLRQRGRRGARGVKIGRATARGGRGAAAATWASEGVVMDVVDVVLSR